MVGCTEQVLRTQYFKVFLFIISLFLVITLVCSIYITGGVTIQWLLLPFVILSIPILIKGIGKFKTANLFVPVLFWVISFISFFLLFYYTCFYNQDNTYIKVPYGDYVTYARIASYISFVGVENNSLDYILKDNIRAIPYHYFELWLTSAIASIFNLNAVKTIILLVFPALWSIITIGIAAIVEKVKTEKWTVKDYILVFLLSFSGGFAFLKPEFLNIEAYPGGLFNMPKVIPITLVLLTALLMYQYALYNLFFAAILLIVPIYTPAAPGIIGGTALFLLYQVMVERISKMLFFKYMIWLFAYFAFTISFYRFFGNGGGTIDSVDLYSEICNVQYWIRALKIALGSNMQILFILPFILIIIVLRKAILKDRFLKGSLILIFLIFSFSAITWALLHPMMDSTQFFSTPLMALFTLLPTLVAVAIIRLKAIFEITDYSKKLVSCMFLAILTLSVFANQFLHYPHRIATELYEKKEVERIKNYFRDELAVSANEPILIGCFFNQDDYSHLFSYNPYFIDPMQFLNTVTDNRFAYVHMNPEQIEIRENGYYKRVLSNWFLSAPYLKYTVMKECSSANSGLSLRLSFIKEKNVRYLAVNNKLEFSTIIPGIANLRTIKIPNKEWILFDVK